MVCARASRLVEIVIPVLVSRIDHLLRHNDNPSAHALVLLGEVGGIDECEIWEALKSGRISKPLIAWCIGTCASIFPLEVQFGRAGALARGNMETARAKNEALKEAGAHVPDNFFEFGNEIKKKYDVLVRHPNQRHQKFPWTLLGRSVSVWSASRPISSHPFPMIEAMNCSARACP